MALSETDKRIAPDPISALYILVACLLLVVTDVNTVSALEKGDVAPKLTLSTLLHDDTCTLDNQDSEYLVVYIWSAMGNKMIEDLRVLQKLSMQTTRSQLKIITVLAFPEDKERARKILRQEYIGLWTLLNDGTLEKSWGLGRQVPVTLVLDRGNTVLEKYQGNVDESELRQMIGLTGSAPGAGSTGERSVAKKQTISIIPTAEDCRREIFRYPGYENKNGKYGFSGSGNAIDWTSDKTNMIDECAVCTYEFEHSVSSAKLRVEGGSFSFTSRVERALFEIRVYTGTPDLHLGINSSSHGHIFQKVYRTNAKGHGTIPAVEYDLPLPKSGINKLTVVLLFYDAWVGFSVQVNAHGLYIEIPDS